MTAAQAEGEVPEVEVRFRRDLRLLDVVMIGLGPTIGTTIFLLPGPGVVIAGPALLLVLVLTAGITLFTAMAYVELSSTHPETGGGYLWIKEATNEPVGFLGGWMSWFGHCIVCAFYVFSFGFGVVWFGESHGLLGGWTPGAMDLLARALSLVVLGAFLFVNYRGTRTTGRSSSTVTIVLLGIVGAFIAFGLLAGTRSNPAPFENFFLGTGPADAAKTVLLGMGFTFIIFEGYEIIAQTAEETRDPARTIARATWITLGIATTIFFLVVLSALLSDWSAIEPLVGDTSRIGDPAAVRWIADTAAHTFPALGLEVIVVGVILGSLAAVNSMVFSSSRVSFAMGRDRSMPRIFGTLHPRNRTPHVAIVSSGLVIGLMVAFLPIDHIAASADIMFLVLFALVNASLIVLRRRAPSRTSGFRTPLFPVIPLLGVGMNGLLAALLFLLFPAAWFLGIGWIVLGFGIHYLWAKRERIVEVARAVEAALPIPEAKYQILVPMEDVEDTAVVRFAALVARVEGGAVTLLNVVEVPPALPVDAIDSLYLLEVRMGLGRAVRAARDAGVDARSKVVVSRRVFDAILDSAKEGETDLLVVGWKGAWRGGRILGSNIDKLVQNAPCDVVVFKSAGMKDRPERILVFNAPEWHVSYATGYAILLAKQHEASILIYTAATTDAELEKEKVYSARLAQMCRTHGVPYEEKFAKVRSIVDAVAEEAKGYDLLAVGATEEWERLENAFGSVPDQIARRAPCPVLMVRKVRKASEAGAA